MDKPGFKKLEYNYPDGNQVQTKSQSFRDALASRRSVRHFAEDPVDASVIKNIIMTAASAPSGANKQPWTFCAVQCPEIKRKIRMAAEKEEYENYHGRMSEEWLKDLAPLDTDWHKEFLETAPWLIVIFKKSYNQDESGTKSKNYYVNESVGIAAGFLIAAIHLAGLVTLTHTPSPMNFLSEILERPENEKPYLLLPVGYPASDAVVPDISRKREEEVLLWF